MRIERCIHLVTQRLLRRFTREHEMLGLRRKQRRLGPGKRLSSIKPGQQSQDIQSGSWGTRSSASDSVCKRSGPCLGLVSAKIVTSYYKLCAYHSGKMPSVVLLGDYAGFPGCGLLRLHSTYRHDLKIYASDEGRVQMTAAAFAKV